MLPRDHAAGRDATIIQVTYATLLGVGFAGLVAYTRSIWPAVFTHAFINLLGSTEDLMASAPPAEDINIANYIVIIAVISLLSTLPGLWFLKKSPRLQAVSA
mgnify:CR=1 FL=1